MPSTAQIRARFRELHESGVFVMPNAFDTGSAVLLRSLGFAAIASSSAGFAWTIGKPDNHVTLEDVLGHLTALCEAVDIPVNADFENAFDRAPEGVAVNVVKAAMTGVAGLSVEDHDDTATPLYEKALAVERIVAAREALSSKAPDVLLVARAEGLLGGRGSAAESIDRLVAFAEAGADVLFAPGLAKPEDIVAAVKAVSPRPLSLIPPPGMSVADIAALGVRRISVGGGLARVAYGAMLEAAKEIAEQGSFAALSHAASGKVFNDCFKNAQSFDG